MGWFGLSKNFKIYRTNNALQWDFAAKFEPVLIDAPVLTLPPPELPSVRRSSGVRILYKRRIVL